MSAVADVAAGTIHAQIDIEAPPEAVFHALTDPRELAAWWGSAETYRTSDWEIDLRPGGKWHCKAQNVAGGHLSTVGGEYLVVEPPRLLVYTWAPSWENFLATTIRCELEAIATGTRVRLTHTGFAGRPEACRSHEQGWKLVLGWLAGRLRP